MYECLCSCIFVKGHQIGVHERIVPFPIIRRGRWSIYQAFVGKACDRMRTPWHTPSTVCVCKISYAFIALK